MRRNCLKSVGGYACRLCDKICRDLTRARQHLEAGFQRNGLAGVSQKEYFRSISHSIFYRNFVEIFKSFLRLFSAKFRGLRNHLVNWDFFRPLKVHSSGTVSKFFRILVIFFNKEDKVSTFLVKNVISASGVLRNITKYETKISLSPFL